MPNPATPLRRSKNQRMIAGVCGGIAAWLGWDVTLVRALYVLISIFSAAFPGVIGYVVLWIVIPEEP
ncbi:MAG: PspC domain-containing protein [Actinomycetota bacterium]